MLPDEEIFGVRDTNGQESASQRASALAGQQSSCEFVARDLSAFPGRAATNGDSRSGDVFEGREALRIAGEESGATGATEPVPEDRAGASRHS